MLNWLTRYAPLTVELELDEGGALRESVLDVGCGPSGLSIVAPEATFVGVDVSFGEPVAPGMVAITYDPGPLPFEDGAFDTVISLDVLEHVPRPARAGFVVELARVCARRVFIACPSDEAVWAEDVLKQVYAAQGVALPGWLNEHDEHGLPTAAEIAGAASSVLECAARPLAMPNGLLSALTVLGDVVPGLAEHAAAEWQRNRSQWEALFRAATFGESYRKAWVIERSARRAALVDPGDVRGTVWGATRCPACGRTTLTLDGDGLRCGACGHTAGRDTSNAIDLHAPGVAAAPAMHASAGHSDALVLRPGSWGRPLDWLPVLSTHIAAVPADRSVTLYLDARDADLDTDTVREMVQSACAYLAGESGFAPVVLMEGTVEPPGGARHVTMPAELTETLGLSDPRAPTEAETIIEHAVWAKTLVDALQAAVDRARYHAAPAVAVRGDPLVTVRIPTYGSVDDLVSRAIPSVLAGGYQNIELLVCSDGPQPHARAAVTAVPDPRVRYLELDERPVYPSWPENFWRTAGCVAVNRMLDEARGDFVAALDHDDGFTHDHIPKLLGALHANGADFVYGQAMSEWPGGDWRLHGTWPMVYGEVIHATVMYSARLLHMRYDPDAWILDEPVDWNLWHRMRDTGATLCHLPEPVAVHFKERSSIGHAAEDPHADRDVKAGDVLATSARALLDVVRRQQ